MSVQINEEAMLIIMSIYGGLILILCYDAIRIFRRVFSVGWIRIIIEDAIFWTVAAIFMFNIYFYSAYNVGIWVGDRKKIYWESSRVVKKKYDKTVKIIEKIYQSK